jgi:hypothetical protein
MLGVDSHLSNVVHNVYCSVYLSDATMLELLHAAHAMSV